MKKKEQRINEIYSFLQESPSLSVKDLSEMLNVSEMTIRRDLKYLKENTEKSCVSCIPFEKQYFQQYMMQIVGINGHLCHIRRTV